MKALKGFFAGLSITVILVTGIAFAVPNPTDQLITLGFLPQWAQRIRTSIGTQKIVPPTTSAWTLRNNADSASNLSITDAGAITVRSTIGGATGLTATTGDITATAGNFIATAGNLLFGAASAKIIPGATSLLMRNNADNATNLSITDAGVVTARAAVVSTGLNFGASSETVAGAGSSQGTAAALSATARVHRITGANGTLAWLLPVSTAGDFHVFLNTTAGVANIYPSTGGTINGAGANAVFAALTGIKPIICVSTTTIDWLCA